MGPIRRHHDEREWHDRRGRFEGLDPDAPDRPQVMPAREAPVEAQTHNALADLTRPDDDQAASNGD